MTSPVQLSPVWQSKLQDARTQQTAASSSLRFVPKQTLYFEQEIRFVAGRREAIQMADFLVQRKIAFVGMDTEYGYETSGVPVRKRGGRLSEWNDPRSVRPLMLTLAAAELREAPGGFAVYRFAVDLRRSEVLDDVQRVLRIPVSFVGHFLQAELLCLWKLGLNEPDQVWDTWAAEKAFHLGTNPFAQDAGNDPPEDDGEDMRTGYGPMSLIATCDRYGVRHPFTAMKKELQASFLNMDADVEFRPDQIDYAIADAVTAAELYLPQLNRAAGVGLLGHLQRIEMSWTVTNARMHWHGVRVDPARIDQLREACQRHLVMIGNRLSEDGLQNARSHQKMKVFMDQLGLLELFRSGASYSFDDKHLEAHENRHRAIRDVRLVRKVERLLSDRLLDGTLTGSDGRLHPEHRQLQAASGRNSMRYPNIGGIGRPLRPVVVPDEGCGIGEVDLVQIEVGIAAAVYGDPDLIRMFNGQDVYVAMARRFHGSERNGFLADLSDSDFKKQHSDLRAQMKVFTLGIIYGMSPFGIASQLNISHREAEREHDRFMAMFPTLREALQAAAAFGAIRGHAVTNTGLKRFRQWSGRPTWKETNQLVNTPVQGSAGNVFKDAGNRLDRRLKYSDARLIMPLHDSFIFEAPLEQMSRVAKVVAEVMRSTVQEHFPQLDPRTDINIDHTSCWNKDGAERSLRLWMVNPELAQL